MTGSSAIMDAIEEVWDSVDKVAGSSYARKMDLSDDLGGMAVIIQEMIRPDWSGVAFSINPVTGRNETVIETVAGSGEQLVQDGLNPERYIYHQGTWESPPTEQGPPMQVLESIVSGLQKLRNVFGGEVDVEWVWDGNSLFYLQCRTVTTGKFPTIYSNHISREFLPGMIKPLVWSINIPVVNSAWLRLLTGMLGKLDIRPEELSRSFYYRAYFNMGTLGALFRMMGLPNDSLESLMGRKDPSGKSSFKPRMKTMRYLPRMTWFIFSNLRLGKKFREKLRILDEETRQIQEEIAAFTPGKYHEIFARLHDTARESAYWNIIIPLTMQISNRMLERKLNKNGQDLHSIDFTQHFPELQDHDPQFHLARLQEMWTGFPDEQRDLVSSFRDFDQLEQEHPLKEMQHQLQQFIKSFGHFSESGNDFSYQPWNEDPDFVLEMIRDTSPLKSSDNPALAALQEKQPMQGRTFHRAGSYRVYREMISSSYTRTYGTFRKLFLQTGNYFSQLGYLDAPTDVFYLTLEEHDQLLGGVTDEKLESLQQKIERVKDELERFSDLTLPSVIYGETPPPIATPEEKTLQGIPVSPGIFEGELIVVKGYSEFKKPVDGKILVIPFSDVGWTPILSRAGAIISESGGILSHASIVARELGIPAVSSVDHACRLKDGIHARVDGYNGVLIIDKK